MDLEIYKTFDELMHDDFIKWVLSKIQFTRRTKRYYLVADMICHVKITRRVSK